MAKTVVQKKIGYSKANTGKKTIGTTVEQLSSSTRELALGVQCLAAPGNTNTVYVGTKENLTAGSNDATDGFPLAAGSSILVPANSESEVYIIGGAASQVLHFMSY